MPNSQRSKKSWWLPRLSSEQEPSTSGTNRLQTFGLLGVCGIGAVLLQTTAFPHFPLVPDLLLILCVYLGIYHGALAGAAGAFFLGYLLDSCSGVPAGMWTLAMSLVFTATKLLSQRLWVQNPLCVLGLVAGAVLLKAVTFFALLESHWAVAPIWSFLTQYVLWDLLLALFLTPLIFALLTTGERAIARA